MIPIDVKASCMIPIDRPYSSTLRAAHDAMQRQIAKVQGWLPRLLNVIFIHMVLSDTRQNERPPHTDSAVALPDPSSLPTPRRRSDLPAAGRGREGNALSKRTCETHVASCQEAGICPLERVHDHVHVTVCCSIPTTPQAHATFV